ncbi:MAG TPA: serine--tRNA ligase [Candidatus Nanoarchaeia archaeon]|nr:serine--tRNA ligase [Candidatus Nanoarchaeia archaeon]
MLDIKFIKENAHLVKENMKRKFQEKNLHFVNELLADHENSLKIRQEVESLRHKRNVVSEEINRLKKEGKDISKKVKEMRDIPEAIKSLEEQLSNLESNIRLCLNNIPNIMHKDIPIGKDSTENVELKKIGKPRKISFEVKNHAQIGEALGVLDFTSSARVSGNGFYYMQKELAILNQALLRFAIDTMIKKGFTYVETPLMVRGDVIRNVTDLNDQENQIYKIENDDLYLIGTSEHSLIGRYINANLEEKQLPIKQTSYSMCFRKEKGSHGIDERGLYRTHQFNKIEMIVICDPKDSMKHFKELQNITIEIFKSLGIPIRVLAICSGDLGNLKHIQVDIEAYSPRKKEYFEVGSCSNLTAAQANKLKIKVQGKEEKYAPHTLNNTAIATSRALVAILENFQEKDGSVKIPKVLSKYMHGIKVIKPQK